MCTISEELQVTAFTCLARSSTVVSTSCPTLNTSPTAPAHSASFISAQTTSLMYGKLRDCLPSPNTVIGWPLRAWVTKVGSTIPYRPVWRGPALLNNLAQSTGSSTSFHKAQDWNSYVRLRHCDYK